MIRSVIVTNYLDDSLEINLARPEETGFLITNISGLGPCKATINMTDVATNDGSIYNSAKLNYRNIVMSITFIGENIEKIRQLSYKYFPVKKDIRLEFVTDNRSCVATGYVESNEPDIFSSEEATQISIICPDAYFYSAKGNRYTTTFYGEEPLFTFPFSNESLTEKLIKFGQINDVTDAVVYYLGDSEVGVKITIHAVGPATGITIYNARTREKMSIDTSKIETISGSALGAGDDIIINTVKGEKSILLLRSGVYTNILNALARDSDWFQLSKGENVFAYTAETGITNLQFKVENDIIYEGI